MSLSEITDRETWLQRRTALLEQEKELTRARDALDSPYWRARWHCRE